MFFECLLCLSNIYFEGAIGYVDVKEPELKPYIAGFKEGGMPIYALTGVRMHDINRAANPMGRVAIGYELAAKKLTVSIELRHESWLATGEDHGQNSVWISSRVRPFK